MLDRITRFLEVESDKNDDRDKLRATNSKDLEERIAKFEGKLERGKKTMGSLRIFFTLTTILFGLYLSISTPATDLSSPFVVLTNPFYATILILGSVIIVNIYVGLLFDNFTNKIQSELDVLYTRKRIIGEFRKGKKSNNSEETDYFDRLVEINLGNLAEYYSLVKIHTNNSFRVSITAAAVGFGLILIGLAIGFFSQLSSQKGTEIISYIASGTGVATEFISTIFFYLYNRTVRQLKDYHDSLLSVQNILLSFKLVGDISDIKLKAPMISQMLVYLVGKEVVNSSTKIPAVTEIHSDTVDNNAAT